MITLVGMDSESIKAKRGRVMIVGVCLFLLGALAVSMPFMASLAVETLVGWLMVSAGVVQAVSGYRERRQGRSGAGDFLWALLAAMTGIILLAKPLSGMVTLTMILSVYFALEGVFKVFTALKLRGFRGWGWLLGSGVLSLVMAGLIWHNLFAAAWGVGLLVGINLLFTGATLFALGLRLGKEPS